MHVVRVSYLERYTIEGDSPLALSHVLTSSFQRVGLFENSILNTVLDHTES